MELNYGNLLEKAKNGEFDVIIQGCNCFHTMGAGIAKYIKQDFPEAFAADKQTPYGDKNKLGTFSEATITRNGNTFIVINAYTQFRYGGGIDNFDYASFPSLLSSIKAKYGDKRIGLPLIGCGLAGGNEPRILSMIEQNFEGVNYKLVEIDTNRKLQLIDLDLIKDENKEMQTENKPKEYTYFFHLTSPFSNFHPAKFEYKGITFISNEQFMMYSKAKNFNDEVSAEKILELNQDPLAKKFLDGELSREDIVKDKVLSDQWNKLMMKVKKLGRGVQNYDEAYWESRRYKIVLFGVRLKFTQNPDLKDILMDTGESKMIESSPYDKVWGAGLSEYDCKRTPEEKWPGRNLLGKILDELKIEFSINIEPSKKFKI